ncbi:hypothetical protein JAAARDRAFT_208852 [Jaapia argillacea MUCL 33604]|uniref:F-box domain-containing protein n=1 Tax=Jaapia argillacea MUCL 33604 TaxID=933084 RepID=A0A067PJM6_9AGAM|nr:hypothetical protein JAAARDRAFT_208852 [Jaapia argillacea MUCL 33604]
MIFQYLLRGSSPLEELQPDECISRQVYLASALLVCRTWYHSGVAMLYSRPIFYLSSANLLVRALRQRDDLSSCVRTIFLMIPPSFPRRAKAPSRYVRDFVTILQTVPSIQSLAMRSHPHRHDPDPPYFTKEAYLGVTLHPPQLQNLSRFVFDGHALSPDTLSHLSGAVFPLLEELSVIDRIVANSFVWPSCPSLTRLQFRSCRFINRNITIRLPVSALKQLDIDQSLSDEDDADISETLYPFASTLEVLRLDTVMFHGEIDFSRLTSVRHLSLFLNASSPPPLPLTVARIPELESLVLTCFGRVDDFSPWSIVERLISLLQSGKNELPVLRVLVIQAHSEEWHALPARKEQSSYLQALCDARGIDLTLRDCCEFRHLLESSIGLTVLLSHR